MAMTPTKFVQPLSPITLEWLIEVEESDLEKKHIRNRAHAIRLSHLRYPVNDISKICKVTAETVRSWINIWKQQGVDSLLDLPRSGRKFSISKDKHDEIIDMVRLPDLGDLT